MAQNLTAIKDRLFELGVSTSTPGLSGPQRVAELQRRLELSDSTSNMAVLQGLTMSEIRSRLTELGESTNTPGLLGDERREALIARLVDALQKSDAKMHALEISPSSGEVKSTMDNSPPNNKSNPSSHTTVKASPTSIRDVLPHESRKKESGAASTISYSDLLSSQIEELAVEHSLRPQPLPDMYRNYSKGDLKREHKNMLNKRSAEFAAKMSGPSQDSRLKESTKLVTKITTEQNRLRDLRRTSRYGSSLLVNGGAMMAIDAQLSILDQLCSEARERVKLVKQKIREECDSHVEYGLLAEDRLLSVIESAPEVRPISRGRAHRRIDELKEMSAKSRGGRLSLDGGFVVDGKVTMRDSMDMAAVDERFDIVDARKEQVQREEYESLMSSMEDVFARFDGKGASIEVVRNAASAPSSDQPTEDVESMPLVGAEPIQDAPDLSPPDRGVPVQEVNASVGEHNVDDGAVGVQIGEVGEAGLEEHRGGEVATGVVNDEEDEKEEQRSESTEQEAAPATMGRGMLAADADDGGEDGESSGGDSEDSDEEDENRIQIRALRAHALVLEHIGDMDAAEAVLRRALDLDPVDVHTLCSHAIFLHRRRGELARAESFFRRALQVCLPSLLLELDPKGVSENVGAERVDPKVLLQTAPLAVLARKGEAVPVKTIVRVLTRYSSFLQRAKGDAEAAAIVMKKTVELAPQDGKVLAAYAHFLAKEGGSGSFDEANQLFMRALRCDPSNPQTSLWYATLLRKNNKLAEAELMFISATKMSAGNRAIEPTAICNYATFMYRQKKDIVQARMIFQAALQRFPQHAGLKRNFKHILKALPPPKGDHSAKSSIVSS